MAVVLSALISWVPLEDHFRTRQSLSVTIGPQYSRYINAIISMGGEWMFGERPWSASGGWGCHEDYRLARKVLTG